MSRAREIADLGSPAASGLSNRNLIINGAMNVAQRGTVASVTNGMYGGPDRYAITENNDLVVTLSQDTDVPTGNGFLNSMKVDVTTADSSTAAGEYGFLGQKFEGQNLQRLKKGTSNAESVTLSFWVKSTITGTYIIQLYDNDNGRHICKSYTVSSSNTWEFKTLTFAGDTTGAFGDDNAHSLQVYWWLVAGSDYTSGTLATSWASFTAANAAVGQVNAVNSTDNNFYLTGVQLEIGTSATPFEHEDFGTTLAKCQRYFFRFQSDTAYDAFAPAYWLVTTQVYSMYEFPVTMRDQPAMTVSSFTSGDWKIHSNGGDGNLGSLIINRCTPNNVQTYSDQSSNTGTAGHAGAIRNYGSTSPYIDFKAELQMKIENAKYHALDGDNTNPNASITCVIDGKLTSVPISEGNADYIEIMRQVAAGTLTIADAG